MYFLHQIYQGISKREFINIIQKILGIKQSLISFSVCSILHIDCTLWDNLKLTVSLSLSLSGPHISTYALNLLIFIHQYTVFIIGLLSIYVYR